MTQLEKALIVMCLVSPLLTSAQTQSQYCTEIGIFNLVFDEDEIAGVYSLNHKEILGAVWGTLNENRMEGRWMDPDGEGDIVIIFNDERTWFTANYRADDEPDVWYRDSWHGAIRPEGTTGSFEVKDKKYQCEK